MNSYRSLNILHIGKFYPPHRGGIETHLQALCCELRKHVEIRVLVANQNRTTCAEQLDGVEVKRLGRLFQFSAASVCRGMVDEIRGSQADIIHIHWPNPTALLAYLASGHKGRLVLTYHSDVIRQKTLAKLFQPILQQVLYRSAVVVAASPNYVEHSPVLSHWRDRCRVIPYGIPVKSFHDADPDKVANVRRQYGPRLVLAVGRLVYYKGFAHLIEAMQHVDGRLLIIGEGPLRAELGKKVEALGVRDRVQILAGIDDLVPYYHAADVFALPSIARSEAFGIVQLEAMACGKPVVNTQLDSGVPYVSPHGVTGLTVPPGDPHALASALTRLLDDSELRRQYGDAARKRVRQEFSLETMTRRTLQLYEDVMLGSCSTEIEPSALVTSAASIGSASLYTSPLIERHPRF